MFFRRQRPRTYTFAERVEMLREAGFRIQETAGKTLAMRDSCAAVIEDGPRIGSVGWIIGNEMAELVDGGNQKYWRTPSGVREAALAAQLQALHAFAEDLREALDLTSLYNESLGTVNAAHAYDRVVDRDQGVPKRAWER
jgi:hypothetical protein